MSITIKWCGACGHMHLRSGAIRLVCSGIWWPGGSCQLAKAEVRLFARLMLANGSSVSTADLIEWLHGDDANGGPICAEGSVRVALFRIRSKLALAGSPMAAEMGRHGWGYCTQLKNKQKVAA